MIRDTYSTKACAKINLALRILGRRPDGYHELDSLVAFADFGDTLHVTAAEKPDFQVSGPFAAALPQDGTNIVQQAEAKTRAFLKRYKVSLPSLAVHLEKALPVASGIGGGSADAAAMIRAMIALADLPYPEMLKIRPKLPELALSLGADVPVCLGQQPVRMRGVGERLEPVQLACPMHLLLINPGIGLLTKSVFAALKPEIYTRERPALSASDPASWGNDLTEAAIALAPEVDEVLTALSDQNAFDIMGMSGSGATCFALAKDANAIYTAMQHFAALQPNWWGHAGKLTG